MRWDFDQREMAEAVKKGDVDFLWAGYQQVYIERDQARCIAVAARDFVNALKSTGMNHEKLDALQKAIDEIRPSDWEAVAHLNAESRAKLQQKYHLALQLRREMREELSAAYKAIVRLVDGWTQLTNPNPDAWPVVLSTSMLLKNHLAVINAALAHKGRPQGKENDLMPKLKTEPCPTCMGKGYLPEQRYCGDCGMRKQFAWKRCLQCKGSGVHIEHLLFTALALPIKETPKLPRSKA